MNTLESILAAGPTPGESHRWIQRALVALFRERPDHDDFSAVTLIAAAFSDGSTAARCSEIRDSISNARRFAAQHPLRTRTAERWRPVPTIPTPPAIPERRYQSAPRKVLSPVLIASAQRQNFDAWAGIGAGFRAPALPVDRRRACRIVLDALYQPNDFICAGGDVKSFRTQTYAEWGEQLLGCQYIVPSPMAAREGRTKRGRSSPRTVGNAASRRRYLVVEFDHAPLPEQAARVWFLSGIPMGLRLIVYSGGKSLHGWFDVSSTPPARVWTWFRLALSLDADPALWLPHQPARMPCGLRQPGGKVQETLFFAPRKNS
jgi:hypothetical protein